MWRYVLLLFRRQPGKSLLAAIDPASEKQLVHLDKSVTSGRALSPKDTLHGDFDPQLGNVLDCPKGQQDPSLCRKIPNYYIPALFQSQLPGQITLRGRFARIAPATLDPQKVLAHGGSRYLADFPALQILFDGLVPLLQNDPRRFSAGEIIWDGHSWQPFVLPNIGKDPFYYSLNFLYAPSGLTYQPTAPPAGQSGSAYVVLPNGVQEGT